MTKGEAEKEEADKTQQPNGIVQEISEPFPNPHALIEFYETFKREADDYDDNFIKGYDSEATATVVFTGLLSLVTSIFIVGVQSQLQPGYTRMSYSLLTRQHHRFRAREIHCRSRNNARSVGGSRLRSCLCRLFFTRFDKNLPLLYRS